MEKNLSTTDRVVRVVVSLVVGFFILNGTITGTIGIISGVVAVILIATGAVSFCPIYAVLRISTRKKVEQNNVVV